MNLYSVLEAGFPPDRSTVCLEIPGGVDRTWNDLAQGSARLASWLVSLGLVPGERVAAVVEKSPEGLMLYLAALRAGLVFLPLNTAYRAAELAYFFGNATPRVVVCPEARLAELQPLVPPSTTIVTLNEDGTGSLWEATASQPSTFATRELPDSALAALLYTSGTTGRSKGAALTHGNLASNAQVLHAYWGWHRDDVLLHLLPIFHIHGLFVAVNGALLAGARMIWLPRFEAKTAVAHLPRATLLMGVPTFYTRLLAEESFTRETCNNVRLFISGSAPLLLETFAAFQERTGHTILERYGMSETGMLASNPYFPTEGARMGGTVGKPLPGVSLRVTGELGMIEVKGPGVFAGYWEMPEKTQEAFTEDGYFRTGDLGQLSDDGYLTLVGRGTDLIISGGFNVYPKEIEGYIDALEGIEESAVVGVPHPDFGEVGVAVVVAKPDAVPDPDQILTALKAQIANFKVPKRVVLVDALPRNTMGKVQKKVLRERYRGAFGGDGSVQSAAKAP